MHLLTIFTIIWSTVLGAIQDSADARSDLAYLTGTVGDQTLVVHDIDHAFPRKVLRGIFYCAERGIVWSGSDELLLLVDMDIEERFGLGCHFDVWSVAKDGSSIRRLTRGSNGASLLAAGVKGEYALLDGLWYGFSLRNVNGVDSRAYSHDLTKAWEPWATADGRSIVFRGWNARRDDSFATYRLDIENGATTRIGPELHFPSTIEGGRKLIGLEYGIEKGARRLLLVDVKSQTSTVLAEDACSDDAPAVAPDGQWICYRSSASGVLQRIRIDGSKLEALDRGRRPTISADGSMIAFEDEGHVRIRTLSTGKVRILAEGSRPVFRRDR